MGNYVNYGEQSLETICLLLAYKIKYPENFFLLRGSHETGRKTRACGFYDECKRRYDITIWEMFLDCFNYLPLASVIDDRIFVAHGGLSPELDSLEQIKRIGQPTDIPNNGLMCDLLYSNPDKDISGWNVNDDGSDDGSGEGNVPGFTFGPDVVSKFLKKHDMDLIVRGHQVVEDGYEFFANRQLITIFSAPNYRGKYVNAGSIMSIDESLLCSFQIIKPAKAREVTF